MKEVTKASASVGLLLATAVLVIAVFSAVPNIACDIKKKSTNHEQYLHYIYLDTKQSRDQLSKAGSRQL